MTSPGRIAFNIVNGVDQDSDDFDFQSPAKQRDWEQAVAAAMAARGWKAVPVRGREGQAIYLTNGPGKVALHVESFDAESRTMLDQLIAALGATGAHHA